MMLRIFAALMLFLLLAPLPGSVRFRPPADTSRAAFATPVAGIAPGFRMGQTTLAEAWDLRSANPRFGGFSGLAKRGPGQFLMISDAGLRVEFAFAGAGALRFAQWGDLPPLDPEKGGKGYRDAEAVYVDPATGSSWIALEGIEQIWRFDRAGKRTANRQIVQMQKWPSNAGPESLTRFADGRFAVISERKFRGERNAGLLFSGDPVRRTTPVQPFWYDSADRGSVTDMAALPDGRVLILHRKLGLYPVFTSTIALADPRRMASGGTLTARTIAVIHHPALAENYEGMAIASGPGGLSLWLASDDNQNDWQATRLIRLIIDPAALR